MRNVFAHSSPNIFSRDHWLQCEDNEKQTAVWGLDLWPLQERLTSHICCVLLTGGSCKHTQETRCWFFMSVSSSSSSSFSTIFCSVSVNSSAHALQKPFRLCMDACWADESTFHVHHGTLCSFILVAISFILFFYKLEYKYAPHCISCTRMCSKSSKSVRSLRSLVHSPTRLCN